METGVDQIEQIRSTRVWHRDKPDVKAAWAAAKANIHEIRDQVAQKGKPKDAADPESQAKPQEARRTGWGYGEQSHCEYL